MSKTCEFCFARLQHNSEWTVCSACDEAMMKQYRAEDDARARRHAAKFHCLDCGKGLPLSRRLRCNECVKPHLAESEDSVWDAADDMNIDVIEVASAPKVALHKVVQTIVADKKKCNDCKLEKPLREFSRDSYTKDMRRNKCKPCDLRRRRFAMARARNEVSSGL